MRRVLLENLPEAGHPARVPQTEVRHLVGVLRLRDGENVEVLDGKGRAAVAKLRLAGPNAEEAWLDFVEARVPEATRLGLHLELAILKADAMSWAIEKAVEIGVDSLTPVLAEHCVVKLTKTPAEFQGRWQRIADQALKQCGRLARMTIELPCTVASLPTGRTRLFCDEGARVDAPGILPLLAELTHTARGQEISLLVGPEGGWSPLERERISKGAQAVSLGPLVLRAETAALFAASVAAGSLRWSAGLAEFGRKF